MRRQAERFAADFEIKSVKGKEDLRLLPQPIYRYTADKGAVEGAVFALAYNSDPEMLVVLELTNPTGDKPAWTYAPRGCRRRNSLRLTPRKCGTWNTTGATREPRPTHTWKHAKAST